MTIASRTRPVIGSSRHTRTKNRVSLLWIHICLDFLIWIPNCCDWNRLSWYLSWSLGNPLRPAARQTHRGTSTVRRAWPMCFASPRVKDPDLKRNKWRFVGMLYCPPFSTVYNIFLCLHIFSVHITHQNKKRNYENDQLSYDNKRGPKVYLHGQCTPPTNFPNVATRNQPKPVWSPAEPELSLSW